MIKKGFLITVFFILINIVNSNYMVKGEEKLIYDYNIKSINGEKIDFSIFKGKTILLVNVASNCGFTKQYNDLQKLWENYKNKNLIVFGVPSNQFGGQEPGTNDEIKNFCEKNFNINFPISEKYDVKGENAHQIYKWAKDTFGNSAIPKWNFHKILIGKNGKVHKTYASFTNPMSNKIIKEIENIL